MSKIIYDAPDSLRTRIQGNLVAAANAWNAEKDRALGVQGSEDSRSKPGEPPRRQTGELQKRTVAVAAASKLEIQIITTSVGKMLNGGTKGSGAPPYRGAQDIAPRPFVNLIINRARAAMREALYRRK